MNNKELQSIINSLNKIERELWIDNLWESVYSAKSIIGNISKIKIALWINDLWRKVKLSASETVWEYYIYTEPTIRPLSEILNEPLTKYEGIILFVWWVWWNMFVWWIMDDNCWLNKWTYIWVFIILLCFMFLYWLKKQQKSS